MWGPPVAAQPKGTKKSRPWYTPDRLLCLLRLCIVVGLFITSPSGWSVAGSPHASEYEHEFVFRVIFLTMFYHSPPHPLQRNDISQPCTREPTELVVLVASSIPGTNIYIVGVHVPQQVCPVACVSTGICVLCTTLYKSCTNAHARGLLVLPYRLHIYIHLVRILYTPCLDMHARALSIRLNNVYAYYCAMAHIAHIHRVLKEYLVCARLVRVDYTFICTPGGYIFTCIHSVHACAGLVRVDYQDIRMHIVLRYASCPPAPSQRVARLCEYILILRTETKRKISQHANNRARTSYYYYGSPTKTVDG